MRLQFVWFSAVLALISGLSRPLPLAAQTSANVAVVINENSGASRFIGEYYAERRGLPAENVLRISTTTDDEISREAYTASIERPIANAIARAGLHDTVLYLVLTKGVPLRIAGTTGREGTVASVDSELTLLYRRMTGQPVQVVGPVLNPYFLGERALTEAQRFSHMDFDIYLVSRLDAFTPPRGDSAGRPGARAQLERTNRA